jgi:MSHA biogenesis protein MshO
MSPMLSKQSGFSLVELIIVIVVGGIIAAMTTSILTLPINAYVDNTRRATLTALTDSTIKRMQRDIRQALPNSIRISADGQTLELLHLVDGGRYRAQRAADASGDILDFTTADTSFNMLGNLQNFANINTANDFLAIYPLATTGNNPYASDNLVRLTNSTTASSVSFNSFQFPLASPQQRFFIVDTPVTYHCNLSPTAAKNKTLMRYQDYSIQASQPTPPSSGGAIQANYLSGCQFAYNSGSSTRSSLVTVSLTLTDDAGESAKLIQQIHVVNQP